MFRDRRGAILILTALAMPVTVLIVGFAADYGYTSFINQRLARAADNAALGAVSQAAAAAYGGYTNIAGLQSSGNAILAENIKQLPVTGATSKVVVASDGLGGVTATATYSANVPTFFGNAIGRTSIPIAGNIQSRAKPLTYINYYILVDTSQSMGIATSQADMAALYQRVVDNNNSVTSDPGCVFGCHVPETQGGHTQKITNEDLAHNASYGPYITLRIDSAVQAIQSIITTAANTVGSSQNVQFALYTIQNNPNVAQVSPDAYITTVSGLSSDYASLKRLAATIDLGDNNSGGYGDSDFTDELNAFNKMLPPNGSGASPSSPSNFVFIITDGVYDSCKNSHCMAVLDSSKCTQLKLNATVGVIYTTYLPIMEPPGSSTYQKDYKNLVYPINNPPNSKIVPALQSCATSTDYYFEATYGSDIISAMQTLFNRTLPTSARLTQ